MSARVRLSLVWKRLGMKVVGGAQARMQRRYPRGEAQLPRSRLSASDSMLAPSHQLQSHAGARQSSRMRRLCVCTPAIVQHSKKMTRLQQLVCTRAPCMVLLAPRQMCPLVLGGHRHLPLVPASLGATLATIASVECCCHVGEDACAGCCSMARLGICIHPITAAAIAKMTGMTWVKQAVQVTVVSLQALCPYRAARSGCPPPARALARG